MPKFNFRNKVSGNIETALPREARNTQIAKEVCDAWCKMTGRIASMFEPVLVEQETVSTVFLDDLKRGFR